MRQCNSILTITLITMISGTFVHAADLYRWQDEHGNVHYTDRVPPEYLKQGYRVISEQGLTIQTIKSKSETAPQKKSPEVSPEQVLKDQRLLLTYSSEEEIITARTRRLADIQALTDLSKETISLLEMQFRQLTKQASDYEKRGKAIPETLLNQTATTRKKISQYQTRVKQQQAEKDRLRQEYDADLARFRQLKSIMDKLDN